MNYKKRQEQIIEEIIQKGYKKNFKLPKNKIIITEK